MIRLLLITILLFFTLPLAAKVCNVLNYIECRTTNEGKMDCEGEIYKNLTKQNLDFHDPPIWKIKLNNRMMPSNPYNICGNQKCLGWVEFIPFKDFEHRYFRRDAWSWFTYNNIHKKYDIYDHITSEYSSPKKFLQIGENNRFVFTEPFIAKWSGVVMTRTSTGICND